MAEAVGLEEPVQVRGGEPAILRHTPSGSLPKEVVRASASGSEPSVTTGRPWRISYPLMVSPRAVPWRGRASFSAANSVRTPRIPRALDVSLVGLNLVDDLGCRASGSRRRRRDGRSFRIGQQQPRRPREAAGAQPLEVRRPSPSSPSRRTTSGLPSWPGTNEAEAHRGSRARASRSVKLARCG